MNLIAAFATFIVLDAIFIGVQLPRFNSIYKKIQGSSIQFRFSAAAACYLCLSVLLYYFILKPKKSVRDAFLLGLCVYGVYETTTYTVLTNYPLSMVILDTLWGGVLFAAAAFVYRI